MEVMRPLHDALPSVSGHTQIGQLKPNRPPFLRLPAELLVDITNRVPTEDILVIRLVSRDLHDAVDGRLLNEYFAEKFQPITVNSLRQLVKITEIPRLRNSIKKLTFVIAPIPCCCSAAEPCPCELGSASNCIKCRRRYASLAQPKDFREELDVDICGRDPYYDYCDPRVRAEISLLMRQCLGEELLTTALTNFKHEHVFSEISMIAGHCQTLESWHNSGHENDPEWMKPLSMRGFEFKPGASDLTTRCDVSSLLLHSVAASGFPLKSLQLLTAGAWPMPHFFRADFKDYNQPALPIQHETISRLRPCFSNLTTLRLGDHLRHSTTFPPAWREPFRSLVQAASGSLTHLSFDFPDESPDPYRQLVTQDLPFVGEIFSVCDLTHLNILGGVFWGSNDLGLLYRSHVETLAHLTVARAVVDDPQGLCMDLAAKASQLKHVELHDINTWYLEGREEENHIQLTGEGVCDGLKKLVADGHWDYDEWVLGFTEMYDHDNPPWIPGIPNA